MNNISEEIINEHLDMMIRLALKQAEAEGLLDETTGDDEPVSESEMKETFDLFLHRYHAKIRDMRHEERRKHCIRIAKMGMRMVICLILVLALAAPIAIASIEPLRTYVVGMLIKTENDHIEIQMSGIRKNNVPVEWTGNYYPEYIPDGYEYLGIASLNPMAMYRNDRGDMLYFFEYLDDTQINIDNEDAEIAFVTVNETTALLAEENGEVRMVWNQAGSLFEIVGNLSKGDAVTMACSVRRIIE